MADQEVIDFGMENYLAQLDKDLSYVDVGVIGEQASKKTDGGLSMAQLATIQEFGVVINVTKKMRGFLSANGLPLKKDTKEIVIPSRPYMRQTFDEQIPELDKRANELLDQVVSGKITKKKALSELGQTHQNQIQSNMATKGKFKENHPFTVERKKSSQPLIDTGRLRQSISHEVG
ncbi:hypothetical protein KAR91_05070 [Candidatus Pacearchaeota archaeon]|nr:hypothetical protein [Candidatus Pacearchaeota archaeon]